MRRKCMKMIAGEFFGIEKSVNCRERFVKECERDNLGYELKISSEEFTRK